MKSKKKIAIETLEKHKKKLSDSKQPNSDWYALLADLLLKYLGKDSLLYNTADVWYSYPSRSTKQAQEDVITGAIEYIQANGVKKENSIWRRIESMNQKVVYASITGIIGLIFLAGMQFSEIKKIKEENELILENKKLREKLNSFPVNPSFDIPKEEADTNAKSN